MKKKRIGIKLMKRTCIITETTIYRDQRGIIEIYKGNGSYLLHVVLFCLVFVCHFIKIS